MFTKVPYCFDNHSFPILKKGELSILNFHLNFNSKKVKCNTCVSVNLSCLDNCIRFDTERYLFFSNSFSNALIWAAVKAVRGRFLRSSLDSDWSSSPKKADRSKFYFLMHSKTLFMIKILRLLKQFIRTGEVGTECFFENCSSGFT